MPLGHLQLLGNPVDGDHPLGAQQYRGTRRHLADGPATPQGDHATWFHARQVGAHAVAAAQSAHGVRVTDDALVSALKRADAGSA
ncbi:hypothetical protein [Streptomyces avermitilis]|uniref:hypothetical protein n=1 Tax=Streptomyces avermitilis TaxID=33903 RepID=UPI0037148E98